MKKSQRRVLSILLVLMMLAIPAKGVFAKENGLTMTISGPGIQDEITLGSSDQLMRLEDSGFFGFSENLSLIGPLEDPGQGYNITGFLNQEGRPIPFVEMVYYPAEEDAGYVHYTSKINGESLKPVDEWARLTLSADQTFRALMTSNNITLQPAILAAPAAVAVEPQTRPEVKSVSLPAATAAPNPALYPALAFIAAILAILVLRKRAVSRRSV